MKKRTKVPLLTNFLCVILPFLIRKIVRIAENFDTKVDIEAC